MHCLQLLIAVPLLQFHARFSQIHLLPQRFIENALAEVPNELFLAKAQNQYYILIILDMPVAFDTVDHAPLLEILSTLGFHDAVLLLPL